MKSILNDFIEKRNFNINLIIYLDFINLILINLYFINKKLWKFIKSILEWNENDKNEVLNEC